MWATLLQRCPHVHSDVGGLVRSSSRRGLRAVRIGGAVEQLRDAAPLQGRQHTGQDFEAQVVLVAQAIGAALDHPDFVVEPLDEAERDLVLRPAVGGNAVPMPIDHGGELLVRLEALPLEARTPILEEPPCPALALVIPQLTEALLEDIGSVEPLVGRKQRLEGLLAIERQILPARQQGVFLTLDVAPVAAGKAAIFALAHRIQGLAEMPHDMELVEQNRGLRRMRLRRLAERLPHVHDGKPDARTLAFAEPGIELAHARLRAIRAAEPDRPAAIKIAHHDPVGVTLANRDLVDADRPWSRRAGTLELRFHILHLKSLDGVPVQPQFRRHVLDRSVAAAPAHVIGKLPLEARTPILEEPPCPALALV